MKSFLFISLGGAMGAAARYGSSRLFDLFTTLEFPLSTIIINTLGCFLLGIIEGIARMYGGLTTMNLLLVTGFLGSFTTFSLYTKELFSFFSSGRAGAGLAYIAAHHAAALLFIFLGYLSGKGAAALLGPVRF